MNDTASAALLRRRARSKIRNGWPSLIVAALVIGAAVYSFSPRPPPVFAPTQVYPDRVLVNGLARQGERLIAVGEQGQILIADAVDGPWRSARIESQRGLTLAQVSFVDEQTALAVGHDGWILRSADRGDSWQEVAFGGAGTDPLLGIDGPYDGRLFAYGAFGLYTISDDLGQTWQPRELVVDEPVAADPAQAAPAADPYADPFASFDAGSIGGSGHLNDMTQAADDSLVLVGERGTLLRSSDNGETWKRLPEIYSGSFFGVLSLPSKALLAFGMRGHVYRSEDFGTSWQESRVPTTTSLFSGVVAAPQRVVLAGAGNAVLVSDDDGRSFALATESARYSIADLLPLERGVWLTASDGGIEIKKSGRASAAGDAS